MGLTYSLTTPATMAAWEEWTERFRRPVAMTLASGFRDAAIHVLGKELQAELQRVHGDRLTMTVLPTDGTPENARLLRDGRAQLGFISSGADVSFDGLRSLAVIERQFVHAIVARRVLEAVYSDAFAKRARIARLSEAGGQDVFGAPLHDGAVAFYRRNDPVSADRFEIAGFALALFGLVGGLRLSGRRNRRRAARLPLTERATADLATLAERAELAPDLATLDQLAVEAAKLNRQAIRDAPRTGLRQADLDLIQRAHDECTQTVRRRKRAVPGSVPRSTAATGAPASAVVPEAPPRATPADPDTAAD
jgi:hypothetical protein